MQRGWLVEATVIANDGHIIIIDRVSVRTHRYERVCYVLAVCVTPAMAAQYNVPVQLQGEQLGAHSGRVYKTMLLELRQGKVSAACKSHCDAVTDVLRRRMALEVPTQKAQLVLLAPSRSACYD